MAGLRFGDVLKPKTHRDMAAVYIGFIDGRHVAVIMVYPTAGLYKGPGGVDPITFLVAFTPNMGVGWEKDESWPS